MDYPTGMNSFDMIKQFIKDNKKYGISQDDFIIFEYSGMDFACVRPYFVVIPEIYQTAKKETEEIEDSYYVLKEKTIEKMICE